MGFRAVMRGSAALFFLVLCLGVTAGEGEGQSQSQSQNRPRELDRTQYGFGWVANAPEIMTGLGGYVLLPPGAWGMDARYGGLGIYVDVKIDLDNPSDSKDFEPGLTAQEALNTVSGIIPGEKESSWQSFNVALVRPMNPYLSLYAGGGYVKRTRYHQYEDPQKNLGRAGVFWVESPLEEDTRFNMMLGILMRLGPRFSSQFGFETQPRGVSVGISLRLPRW